MSLRKMVGKEMLHPDFGRVLITSVPKKAKVSVNIKVVQRGPGWHEPSETYRRYFIGAFLMEDGSRSLRWGLTHRDEYGHEEKISINDLTPVTDA